jgi:TM2 domain-containing membrane protein YozV
MNETHETAQDWVNQPTSQAQPQFPMAQQQYAYQQPAPQIIVTNGKSAGLAVFFTFLWLGAGHLYVNKIGTGIALIIFDLFLVMLSFTFVGLILAFPAWLVTFLIAAPLAANGANKHNAKLGFPGIA